MWGFQRQEVRWLLGLKLLETHWLKVRGGCSHLCNWCSTLDWSQGCLLGFAMAACAWQCSCRKCSPRAVPRHYTLMASEIKWTHPKHLLGIGFALRSCPGERTLHTWSADQPRRLNLSAWEHPDTIWSMSKDTASEIAPWIQPHLDRHALPWSMSSGNMSRLAYPSRLVLVWAVTVSVDSAEKTCLGTSLLHLSCQQQRLT